MTANWIADLALVAGIALGMFAAGLVTGVWLARPGPPLTSPPPHTFSDCWQTLFGEPWPGPFNAVVDMGQQRQAAQRGAPVRGAADAAPYFPPDEDPSRG